MPIESGFCTPAMGLNETTGGDLLPAFGHRVLQRGPAGDRSLQVLGRKSGKPLLVHQRVKQRVDAADPGDGVVLEGTLQVADRPRARHQDIARAGCEEAEQIEGEGEDVIQRQRGEHDLLALVDLALAHRKGLIDVGQQVAVR